MVVVYSYGCSDLWKSIAGMGEEYGEPAAIDELVIVAGVPRALDGQFGFGLWHVPGFVKAATAFNPPDGTVPVSCPIRNVSAAYRNVAVAGVDHGTIVAAVQDEVVGIARSLLERVS
jgi:hypothetical protein